MMKSWFSFGLKAIAKPLAAMVVGVMVLFGFSQTAALAQPMPTTPAPTSLIALAASSRFAANKELEGQEPIISESRLEEMREQRREWQSEASAAAAAALDNTTTEDTVGGTVKDKLNLEEITEENEIVGRIKNSQDK